MKAIWSFESPWAAKHATSFDTVHTDLDLLDHFRPVNPGGRATIVIPAPWQIDVSKLDVWLRFHQRVLARVHGLSGQVECLLVEHPFNSHEVLRALYLKASRPECIQLFEELSSFCTHHISGHADSFSKWIRSGAQTDGLGDLLSLLELSESVSTESALVSCDSSSLTEAQVLKNELFAVYARLDSLLQNYTQLKQEAAASTETMLRAAELLSKPLLDRLP